MGVDWWLDNAVNDSYAAHCCRLNLQTSELRAEVTRMMTHGIAASAAGTSPSSPSSPSSPRSSSAQSSPSSTYEQRTAQILSLMRRSQDLDRAIVDWMACLPPHWHYRTLCWQNYVANTDYAHAEVFPGRVDVYNDVWIASVWNMARVTRLILASITVRCAAWACSPVDYRTTPEYAHSARVCAEVIGDVLASVPYHLGWHYRTKRRQQGQGQGQDRSNRNRNWNDHDHDDDEEDGEVDAQKEEQLSGFGCGEDEDGIKGLSGYFLTWPLACVMGQDYLTEDQRTWVRGRLRYIGQELGIRYASILAQVSLESWVLGLFDIIPACFVCAHEKPNIRTDSLSLHSSYKYASRQCSSAATVLWHNHTPVYKIFNLLSPWRGIHHRSSLDTRSIQYRKERGCKWSLWN